MVLNNFSCVLLNNICTYRELPDLRRNCYNIHQTESGNFKIQNALGHTLFCLFVSLAFYLLMFQNLITMQKYGIVFFIYDCILMTFPDIFWKVFTFFLNTERCFNVFEDSFIMDYTFSVQLGNYLVQSSKSQIQVFFDFTYIKR